jgi:hypothetical protein
LKAIANAETGGVQPSVRTIMRHGPNGKRLRENNQSIAHTLQALLGKVYVIGKRRHGWQLVAKNELERVVYR